MIVRLGAFLLALGILVPQTRTTPPTDAVIRINVNLVQIDAVVTDKHGKPVTDLQASEFEVLQDGRAQTITNFSFLAAHPGDGTAPAQVARPDQKRQAAPPPAVLKIAQIRRTMALVVDDLGLSFDSISRVRLALHKFVDREMQPGDLIAVIRTGAGMGALQQFTSDPHLLHAAIDHVRFNAFGRVGVDSFTPMGSEPRMANADAEMARSNFMAFRQDISTNGTLGAIRFVLDGLRDLPSRKYIVLFSENLLVFNRQAGLPVDALVQHLTDTANRASVVIYSIDPRGLQVHSPTAADDTRNSSPRQVAAVPMRRSAEEFYSRDGMVALAAGTGGMFLRDTNDLDGAVREVVRDTEGYYLIGYHPDSSTFERKGGQALFHKVTVRVKRAGLQVRSRSGFFGAPDRESQGTPVGRESEILHALRSPFSASGIHVRLTPLFSNTPETGSYLRTLLYIDAKDLQFTDQPDGFHQAVVDVVAMTFGDSDQAVDTTTRSYTVRASSRLYEEALKQGLLYSVAFQVKNVGAYQMRAVVRDANSAKLGSASQFIEVPDIELGRLTLSSITLREQPPQAGQGAGERAEGQVADANPEGSEAVRVFRPGSSIQYSYHIFNAQAESGKAPVLESQTRVFHDGKPFYAAAFTALDMVGKMGDPKRLDSGGSMKLSEKFPPGDYVLQIVVTDKLAKEKYRTASQWMDFEVR